MAPEEPTDAHAAMLGRQLERERRARRAAEQIGEVALTERWHTVQRLERAEAELREAAQLTELSYALSQALRSDLDPALMLDRAVRALGESLGVDRVVIRLADEHHIGGLMTQWAAPDVPELPVDTRLDDSFGSLVAHYADEATSLWIEALDTDDRVLAPRRVMDYLQCRAYAGVPLLAGSRLVGWLALHTHTEPREWSRRDRIVTEALAHDLSGALLQAQAHQRQLDTVRQLQQLDDVKNHLVWRVSHELRTPLTSIRGYTELLADGEVGDPSPAQQRTLVVILRNCDRLLALTENLLSLSKVDSHEFQPVRDPVDVVGLLGRVGDRAAALTEGRSIELLLPGQVPREVELWGDEAELERVLVNLLDNALKFTPDGGQVTLAVSVAETTLSFDVSDTGCGIDPDDHQRVFERFFRTKRATESEVPGAGLGLALVESIVRAHDGVVVVESEPDQGSRFRVVLPIGAG